jgi:hypothetical protein
MAGISTFDTTPAQKVWKYHEDQDGARKQEIESMSGNEVISAERCSACGFDETVDKSEAFLIIECRCLTDFMAA